MGLVRIDPTFGDDGQRLNRPLDLGDIFAPGPIVADPLPPPRHFDPVIFDPRESLVIFNDATNDVQPFGTLPTFAREATITRDPLIVPDPIRGNGLGIADLIAAPFTAAARFADAATDSLDAGAKNLRALLPWIVALGMVYLASKALPLFAAAGRGRSRRRGRGAA